LINLLLFIATLAAAAFGGITAYKLKIPAGGMIGAMAAVIILNISTGRAFFYEELKPVIQILSGAMIGSGIGRKDVAELRKIVLPTIFLVFCMILLNLSFSAAIVALTRLDIATALFATAPGGVADMALIATDLGANSGYVAILQLFRLLIIFTFMPPIFKTVIGRINKAGSSEPAPEITGKNAAQKTGLRKTLLILFRSLVFAAAAGLLFQSIGITAGALIGGMVGAAASGLIFEKSVFPQRAKLGLQIFAGAFIGIRMDRESLVQIPELIVPILIMTIGVLVFVFLVSYAMHKLTGLPLATCMLASTPGGIQEMALLADDLGADTTKVSIMQTARLMCVISFFPTMINFVMSFFT